MTFFDTVSYPPTPKRFFEELILRHDLFRPEGRCIELRWIERGKVTPVFFRSNNVQGFLDRIADNCKTQPPQSHWYFGVHPRDRMEGTSEAVTVVTSFHADLDFKTRSYAAWTEMLRGFELPVTVVVATGNGLHAYWLLKEPELLETDRERARFVRVQADLQAQFGADRTHDLARVLRVPGSTNWKDPENPKLCQIVWGDFSRRYTISRVAEAVSSHDTSGELPPPGPAPAIDDAIAPGKRNVTLVSLAGTMRKRGMTEEEIRAGLEAVNQRRCNPALPAHEIGQIAKSVCRYSPGNSVAYSAPAGASVMRARKLEEIESRQVQFLWYPYLPIGKLTLLDGDPGVGKSYLTGALASGVTRGFGLPGVQGGRGPVLMLAAEDGAEDTIRPRLEGMGVDLSQVYIVSDVLTLDAQGSGSLEVLMSELRPVLTVIDPVTAYLGAGLDIHRANEVRQWMQRLAEISDKCRSVTLLVRHLRKETARKGANPIYRGLGSIDFAASVRSILMVHQAEDYPALKIVRHIKSNLGPLGAPLQYTVDERGFRWYVAAGGEG